MTDKLIVLNKKNEGVQEGFIKLESGKQLLIAFKGDKGEYMAICDSLVFEFNGKPYCRFSFNKQPENAGIFLIKDGFAYLMLYFGNEDTVTKNFTKKTGIEIKDAFIVSEPSEPAEIILDVPKTAKIQPEYKETGYVLPENFIQPPEEIPDTFFDCNKEKFNEILYNNPANEALMSLIPESKWVDVEDENHTFGIIYDENNVPLYICYGFKLGWSEEPPEKLEGYCQWIPLDCADPRGDGLWVIYINAQTGERLK